VCLVPQRKVLLELRKLYVRNLAGMVARRERLMAAIQVGSHCKAQRESATGFGIGTWMSARTRCHVACGPLAAVTVHHAEMPAANMVHGHHAGRQYPCSTTHNDVKKVGLPMCRWEQTAG
jgi:hypothetical protein